MHLVPFIIFGTILKFILAESTGALSLTLGSGAKMELAILSSTTTEDPLSQLEQDVELLQNENHMLRRFLERVHPEVFLQVQHFSFISLCLCIPWTKNIDQPIQPFCRLWQPALSLLGC
jgi:hypothetical protein